MPFCFQPQPLERQILRYVRKVGLVIIDEIHLLGQVPLCEASVDDVSPGFFSYMFSPFSVFTFSSQYWYHDTHTIGCDTVFIYRSIPTTTLLKGRGVDQCGG